MTTILLGIISCQDKIEAEVIGEMLLKKRLAGCVQILPTINSSFLWPTGKNNIDTATESLLLVKTIESKWATLEQEVKKIHSYQNPEIIGLPVSHVSQSYLAWLTKELT